LDLLQRLVKGGVICSVHTAHSFYEEFLASDDFGRFACMITDIHMPGMNGFELKERLDESSDSFPVIMITARTEPDLEEKANSCDALCFLRKPFEVEAVGCIDKALRH
jgi:FixJ family two-component response regulator